MKLWWSLANAWVHAVTALRNMLVFDTIRKLFQLCDRRVLSVLLGAGSVLIRAFLRLLLAGRAPSSLRAGWMIGVGHTANV